MLAVVFFIKHFRHYLSGREFILRTDHASLVWLHRFKEPDGQISRWLQQLGQYVFKIVHRAGKRHGNADALSRLSENSKICKQCNFDLDKEDEEETVIFTHSEDLKLLQKLDSDDEDAFQISGSNRKTDDQDDDLIEIRPRGRIPNVPQRARQRRLPDVELTSENIRNFQLKDPAISAIMKMKVQSDEKPPFKSVSHMSFDTKFWYSRWELLCIFDGMLCIKWIEKGEKRLKICTPPEFRDTLLWFVHDSPLSGHLGIKRTLSRVWTTSYYWPKMRQYISDYVKSCDICEERKNPNFKKRNFMKPHVSGARFERIAMDIAGPFPKTRDGNSYILVIADYFTKFTEIFPIRNIEAETVTETVFKGWIKRYGCPQEIHSDQGAQFESQVFQEMCRFLKINKTRTTPYHPRSDGMVERLNRTIKDMIAKYVSANQTDWDRYIDGLVLAYNTSLHESTGITPYRLVFGTECTVRIDIITPKLEEDERSEYLNASEFVRNLDKQFVEINEISRRTTLKSTERQKKEYDRKVKEITYDIGDLVRRNQRKLLPGAKEKLSRNWSGPWIVIKRLSDVLYMIQHSKNSKPVVIHADKLKPYRGKRKLNWVLKQTKPEFKEELP
ncbi:hypothetical protein FSP39_010929 [Pinctada imbricata]|uniref:Integrase catalytic domain-containing protein n=1 Tax=Pinctada imbricata TaxID=66713 RepID=A0AA88YG53_PINIB|nr:hypothetical protein FSP39_010929 [Pinctada imbricata]